MIERVQFEERLRSLTADFLELNEAQVEALFRHYGLLKRWNRVLNLTRIDALEEAVERHYAESLFLASRIGAAASVADMGSGAGFPGIPVAVADGRRRVVLVESDVRKAAFLREARDFAPNAEILAVRAESVSERFDVLVSRAVKPAEVLKVARRVAEEVFLLISEADARTLTLASATVTPLPFSRGGVLWHAQVPRGT